MEEKTIEQLKEEYLNLVEAQRVLEMKMLEKIMEQSNKIEKVEVPIDELPVKILFCLFMRGQWWSIVDIVKNTQQLLDRYFSHLDFAIGASTKTGGEVNTSVIDEDYNRIETINDKFIKGEFVITQYTLPLTYNGNMSITTNEALTRV